MNKTRVRRSRPAEVAEHSAPEGVLQAHADAVVTTLHIRHVLSLLNPGHRDPLEQVYLNGCTAREAGDAQGHLAAWRAAGGTAPAPGGPGKAPGTAERPCRGATRPGAPPADPNPGSPPR